MKKMMGILISGNIANGPPVKAQVKRPFRIGAYIGIAGGVLAILGTSLPWLETLATGIHKWTLGIGILSGKIIFIIGLITMTLFAFRKRVLFIAGVFMGLFVLLFAWFVLQIIFIGGSVEYGVYVSITGGILIIVGGFIGFIQAPKTQNNI